MDDGPRPGWRDVTIRALESVVNAQRMHPEKNGSTYWGLLLTPRQLALCDEALAAVRGGP